MDYPKKDPKIIPLQTDNSKVSPLRVNELPSRPRPPLDSDVAERIQEQTDIYRQKYLGRPLEQRQADQRQLERLEEERKEMRRSQELAAVRAHNKDLAERLDQANKDLELTRDENKTFRRWLRALADEVTRLGIYVELADQIKAFFVEEALTAKGGQKRINFKDLTFFREPPPNL